MQNTMEKIDLFVVGFLTVFIRFKNLHSKERIFLLEQKGKIQYW